MPDDSAVLSLTCIPDRETTILARLRDTYMSWASKTAFPVNAPVAIPGMEKIHDLVVRAAAEMTGRDGSTVLADMHRLTGDRFAHDADLLESILKIRACLEELARTIFLGKELFDFLAQSGRPVVDVECNGGLLTALAQRRRINMVAATTDGSLCTRASCDPSIRPFVTNGANIPRTFPDHDILVCNPESLPWMPAMVRALRPEQRLICVERNEGGERSPFSDALRSICVPEGARIELPLLPKHHGDGLVSWERDWISAYRRPVPGAAVC